MRCARSVARQVVPKAGGRPCQEGSGCGARRPRTSPRKRKARHTGGVRGGHVGPPSSAAWHRAPPTCERLDAVIRQHQLLEPNQAGQPVDGGDIVAGQVEHLQLRQRPHPAHAPQPVGRQVERCEAGRQVVEPGDGGDAVAVQVEGGEDGRPPRQLRQAL